jgi:hypothetical protein
MRCRWKSSITALAAAVATSAVTAGVAGCKPGVSTAAASTVVCGTVLSNSVAAPVVFDATRRLPIIKGTTVGGVLMFRVARGCDNGTHVSWDPRSAAHLVKAAYARDGLPVAVVLKPSGSGREFRLTGTRNGKVVASATAKPAA